MKQPFARFMPARDTFAGRLLKAGSWSMGQVLISHALRLGSNLIMTRLLLPDAFGLMAMVGTVLTGFALLTDIGIHRSIMREPDGDQDHFLRAAWTVKLGRGGLIAAGTLCAAVVLWWLAPAWAAAGTVYADPRLPILIALSALAPLLQGAESTTRELMERQLRMHYTATLEVVSQVLVIMAMVAFATISPTVWALMAGMLVGPVVQVIGTHLFFPGPRMAFVRDAEIAGRLWRYGKWLMVSAIFTFVATNADRFILGGLLDATVFGFYSIAQVWIGAGNMVIARLSDQIGFPAITEIIRTRPDEVPRLFRKFQTVIDLVCAAAFVILFLGGRLLIDLLYTATYDTAGTYIAILSLSFLALRFNTLGGLLMSGGNSRAIMVIWAMRAVALCISLPLAYDHAGMTGALLAVALYPLVSVPYTIWLATPILSVRQTRWDWLWLAGTLVVAGGVIAFG
ncbi:oligosaccharide flippase family protein [Loktanella sp. DJP18]|uniref:oligosaccharide flippase family protein n=1 Tax=Loktanella sp. DJP18 TaxID=3409788 RepID=UPI003BB6EA5B